jgi:hypothetical protein
MRVSRILGTAAALVVASAVLAPVGAAAAQPTRHARFEVSALALAGHTRTYDVGTVAAVVRARVQVKDHDKAFDPATVTLTLTEQASGVPVATSTVDAVRVGHSRVVSNWHATVTVPAGAVAPGATATYCVRVVTVADQGALPVTARARGLAGRDCFTVTNSTPAA